MTTERVTTHRDSTGTSYRVRYGTPSSFDALGTITRSPQGWTASMNDESMRRTFDTKAEAVSALVKWNRVNR